ncbi:MAG: hypothetical protein FRX49_08066 [Trebouxia sp. A1-2]|nr:MAG: hypothetical protein FRX49_08066 [Trebouxia sp. A1-2]
MQLRMAEANACLRIFVKIANEIASAYPLSRSFLIAAASVPIQVTAASCGLPSIEGYLIYYEKIRLQLKKGLSAYAQVPDADVGLLNCMPTAKPMIKVVSPLFKAWSAGRCWDGRLRPLADVHREPGFHVVEDVAQLALSFRGYAFVLTGLADIDEQGITQV